MRNHRILIVDDDDLVLRSLQVILEDEGYEIATVRSSAEAIALVRQGEFQVLLSDLTVVEQSDFDLFDLCCSQGNNPEIIVLSGYAADEIKQRLKAFDIRYHFTKPISDGELKEAVRSLMQIAS